MTRVEEAVAYQVVAMGTTAELMIVGGETSLLEWAVARLASLEASWSRFRPDSDLGRLQECAGAGPAAASPDLIDAVGRALSLWYVTDGLFDPTVRRALEAIGYDRTFREVTATGPALVDLPRPAPGCVGLRVDRERGTITVPEDVYLDLGGLGKGLAADVVATGLVERGAVGACVGMGGDIRVAGMAPDGGPWNIRVEDPFDSGTFCTRTLGDDAIVTSTTRFRRWSRGGRTLHHIIDPTTGSPADRGVSAVVAQADEAWWAEGVAKAALVAGLDAGFALLNRLGVAAVLFDSEGGHRCTGAWGTV